MSRGVGGGTVCGHSLTHTHTHSYCFQSSYFPTLLTRGYHIPANSTAIQFTGSVGGNEVSFALGGILSEANLLPFVLRTPECGGDGDDSSKTVAIVAAVVLGVLAVAFALATLVMYGRYKSALERKRDEHMSLIGGGGDCAGLLGASREGAQRVRA